MLNCAEPVVPAWPHFTREFVRDKTVLQREAIGGSPGLQRAAYAGLGVIALAWITSLAWGLRRLDRSAGSLPRFERPHRPSPSEQATAPEPVLA